MMDGETERISVPFVVKIRPKALRVIAPRLLEEVPDRILTMRLIHLSDLHFGAVDPRLPHRLRAAVIEAKPDLVAISGDLTQRGLERSFWRRKPF